MAYFNVNCHCAYTMSIHKYERAFLSKKYAHIVTQCGNQTNIVPRWCLHHIAHYETKNLSSFDDVCWCWKLTPSSIDISIKDCMFTTSTTENSKGCWCSIVKFDSNWAYSQARGSLIIDVGWSSTSFPFIGSSFKFKSKWISLPYAKSTNSTMLYYASTISSPTNCTYSSISISSLPRFKEENETCQWHSYVASYVLNFSCSLYMEKYLHSNLHVKSWNPPIISYDLGFVSLQTWEHHIIACLH